MMAEEDTVFLQGMKQADEISAGESDRDGEKYRGRTK